MRILLVPASYPPVLGGVQTVAHNLSLCLIRSKHQVSIITNRYPISLPKHEILDGISVHRYLFVPDGIEYLKRRRWDLFLAQLYFYPTTFLSMDSLFKSFVPDVVNVHYPDVQLPFVLRLWEKYKFRLVISLHGNDILPPVNSAHSIAQNKLGSTRRKQLRYAILKADAVTACSRYLLDQGIVFEPTIKEKGIVIPNGITAERFRHNRQIRHHRKYIFAFGRLTYQKGFDLLLKAFANTSAEFGSVDLILAGDGDERRSLISLCHQLRINDRVFFWGPALPDEVVMLLNGCEFVVIPSRWEPFGIAALEALAAGKPVLSTNVGGLPEFVGSPANELVDPDAISLRMGLEKWLDLAVHDSLPRPDKEWIHEKYEWREVVSRYEKVLAGN